ncbi:MAG: response regulator transcription factor [Acidimicrobiales bacterium]
MILTRSNRARTDHPPTRVLVVDGDLDAAHLLDRVLSSEGFETATALTRARAKEAAADFRPDLILLARSLNGEDSIDLLVDLRRVMDFPVILISGEGQESDKVLGLRMGADDYVVKPFAYAELVARIQAVIRRCRPKNVVGSVVFGGLELDSAAREVRLVGKVIETTAKEFDLLAFLAASPRQVFSRDQLLEQVWGSSSEWQDPATVTEHVRRVRAKLAEASGESGWITTLRGTGYRFDPPLSFAEAV